MNNAYLSVFFALALAVPAVSAAAPLKHTASAECMGCPAEVAGAFEHTGDAGPAGHFRRMAGQAEAGSLVPPSKLSVSVMLVGGKISCITCHIAYDEDTHEALAAQRASAAVDPLLSVDNTASGLCAACHAK